MGAVTKIPVGAARGKLITECTVAELEAACDDVDARLCAAKSEVTTKKHKAFVGAARSLLKSRKFPTGSYHTTDDANGALRDAAEVGYLLSPQTEMAALLPGCALLITAFRADPKRDLFPDDENPELLVPGKTMLDRIARDLGVSWRGTHRTDHGRDPYLRSYHAEGSIRGFDSTQRGIEGNAGVDLNQDSALVKRLRAKNVRRDRGDFDVERRRELIDSICDTQARLKACRQLGVRSTYTITELSKAFFCARLQFTARTNDPELKQMMGQHVVDSFKSSSVALYGKRAAGQR
jgi:hypothetical protein